MKISCLCHFIVQGNNQVFPNRVLIKKKEEELQYLEKGFGFQKSLELVYI